MTNIILCGGSGTRLWPISRTLMPKQFIKLFLTKSAKHKDKKSLFELTVERNSKVCDKLFIVSNTEQHFLALNQLKSSSTLSTENTKFLLEPIGKNTAPAIALACMELDKDEIVLVTPSDHLIKDEIEYKKVLEAAIALAKKDNLVTFGIVPTFAEIGFGYIEADGLNVKAFHEKPDFKTAQKYINNGNYYWNSGMFMFKAGVFLEELKKYSPKTYNTCKIASNNKKIQNSTLRIQHSDMEAIPSESIDYAIMEKSSVVKVVPSSIEWSDVGSFDSLAKELPNDSNNNLIISDKLVKTIDIKDSIIIDTGDALLVSKKGSSQKVKNIVNALKKEGSELPDIHLTGYRPWGSYTVLEDSDGYKIKRIVVEPHKRLSLQKHKYRNEHWVVVSGTATVIINDKTFELNQNESTYIKAGDVHRLANNTDYKLIIIEVQAGSYTGEDDIIRLEDDYERN